MPLCLIQSLPGVHYSLTDVLTVAVPDLSESVPEDHFLQRNKEVREGRAAWHHTDSRSPRGKDDFSFDRLSSMCKAWRNQGIFSFIEVRLSGEMGEPEKNVLQKLKQAADWLVLDGSLTSINLPGVLRAERWEQQIHWIKEIGKRVGLRVRLDPTIPNNIQFPWIAKAVLELGAPGFLFLEMDRVDAGIALIRGVQDILLCHPLSKDAARIIPIVRSSVYTVAEKPIEVLDFHALDNLLIESYRPFFGGVAVRQAKDEKILGLSLWSAIAGMIVDKRSSASLLEHIMTSQPSIPEQYRLALARQICCLILSLSLKDYTKMQQEKIDLERTWGGICRYKIVGAEEASQIKQFVVNILDHCSEVLAKECPVPTSRPSMIGSFFRSMNV
jgi:hypothetical protein